MPTISFKIKYPLILTNKQVGIMYLFDVQLLILPVLAVCYLKSFHKK